MMGDAHFSSRLGLLAKSAVVLAATASLAPLAAFAQDATGEPAGDADAPPVARRPATAPATGPATAPAAGADASEERLRVIVAEVTGIVHVGPGRDGPWRLAESGMELAEGVVLRTGPNSKVACVIPPDQTFVLDRLGIVSVVEAVRRAGITRTDLTMTYGRAEYEIEAAGAEHDATLRSRSSTLAVRGTRVSLYDQPPFTPEARSFTGRAVYQYAKRQTALGGPGRGARVRSDRGTAAESALGETVVDPAIAAARTGAERALIASEVSRGGLIDFDERAGINVVRNSPPFGDEELAANLPGRLNFVLRWTGDANLDLAVVDFRVDESTGFDPVPQELIFPGFGLQQSLAGGETAFDHRGGPGGGQEIVFYPSTFRTGTYGLQALFASGETTDVAFNAFLDGEPLEFQVPLRDENGNVVTEPFTLPNGMVVQVPVLVATQVVRDTLGPNDPATDRQEDLLAINVEVPEAFADDGGSAELRPGPRQAARASAAGAKAQRVAERRAQAAQRREASRVAKLEKRQAKQARIAARAAARAARMPVTKERSRAPLAGASVPKGGSRRK